MKNISALKFNCFIIMAYTEKKRKSFFKMRKLAVFPCWWEYYSIYMNFVLHLHGIKSVSIMKSRVSLDGTQYFLHKHRKLSLPTQLIRVFHRVVFFCKESFLCLHRKYYISSRKILVFLTLTIFLRVSIGTDPKTETYPYP